MFLKSVHDNINIRKTSLGMLLRNSIKLMLYTSERKSRCTDESCNVATSKDKVSYKSCRNSIRKPLLIQKCVFNKVFVINAGLPMRPLPSAECLKCVLLFLKYNLWSAYLRISNR